MNILERVAKLVALAGSSNENEARNAAHEACRLIREHRLLIVPTQAVAAPPKPPPKPTVVAKRVVLNFINIAKEANARRIIEERRPDLRRLTQNYSSQATLKLAEIAAAMGLTEEAAVLRAAAS
jgi:DMSO/TMAO reductase YedYZ molybdopterin-dependent catalytic subunit